MEIMVVDMVAMTKVITKDMEITAMDGEDMISTQDMEVLFFIRMKKIYHDGHQASGKICIEIYLSIWFMFAFDVVFD